MRRSSREIEIFSLSALDLFASTLGAFIFVSIILYPYYKKNSEADVVREKTRLAQVEKSLAAKTRELEQVRAKIERQQSEVNEVRKAEQELMSCRKGTAHCQAQLSRTFLMVMIEWSASVDVNLSVTDPHGNVFTWDKSNRNGRDYPNTKARLSIDVLARNGIEVWIDPSASSGRYVVEYFTPVAPTTDATVKGKVFERKGTKSLPETTLRAGMLRARVATIEVDESGEVSLR